MTSREPAGGRRARALPPGWTTARVAHEGPSSAVQGFDVVLVSSREQYQAVAELGGDPILITRDFSATDRRGKLRLRLGVLLVPWRWRRTLLNEGVGELVVSNGLGSTAFHLAARLGRVHVTTVS